ncbi:hypothetical protein DFH28DRAFT_1103538 [Melampsora americana]|nr:hypothetical protein DFH28DRAFT_1103538 [Melampsora americana]
MKQVKDLTGIGWVGGRIEMPNEWWEATAEEVEIEHDEAVDNKDDDEVDADGLTQEEQGFDDGPQEVQGSNKGKNVAVDSAQEDRVMVSDDLILPAVDLFVKSHQDHSDIITFSTQNRFINPKGTQASKGFKSNVDKDFIGTDDTDLQDDKPPTLQKPVTVFKVKTPARKDLVTDAKAALERDQLNGPQSLELNNSYERSVCPFPVLHRIADVITTNGLEVVIFG